MNWEDLKPGDFFTVAVPWSDGTYDVQQSEVIQCHLAGEDLSYLMIKFKFTQPSGKRGRYIGYIHDVTSPVLYATEYKELTSKRQRDSLIISCVSDETELKKAITSVFEEIIGDYEKEIADYQQRIETLRQKIADL